MLSLNKLILLASLLSSLLTAVIASSSGLRAKAVLLEKDIRPRRLQKKSASKKETTTSTSQMSLVASDTAASTTTSASKTSPSASKKSASGKSLATSDHASSKKSASQMSLSTSNKAASKNSASQMSSKKKICGSSDGDSLIEQAPQRVRARVTKRHLKSKESSSKSSKSEVAEQTEEECDDENDDSEGGLDMELSVRAEDVTIEEEEEPKPAGENVAPEIVDENKISEKENNQEETSTPGEPFQFNENTKATDDEVESSKMNGEAQSTKGKDDEKEKSMSSDEKENKESSSVDGKEDEKGSSKSDDEKESKESSAVEEKDESAVSAASTSATASAEEYQDDDSKGKSKPLDEKDSRDSTSLEEKDQLTTSAAAASDTTSMKDPQDEATKVTICHGTGNAKSPWHKITIAHAAVDAHFKSNHAKGHQVADAYPHDAVEYEGVAGTLDDECGFLPNISDKPENLSKASDMKHEDPILVEVEPERQKLRIDEPEPKLPSPMTKIGPMTIYIMDNTDGPNNGQKFPMEVEQDFTLEVLRNMIEDPTGIESDKQQLEFGGEKMNDEEKTLGAYLVEDGSTLVLSNKNVASGNHPGGMGDPHFKTFQNNGIEATRYDFHGACDLVLVESPDFEDSLGLKIHIRTKIKSWFSYIESVAIQIGSDILEVKGGDFNERRVFFNGRRETILKKNDGVPFRMAGTYPVEYQVVKKFVSFQFKIMLSDDQYILIRAVKDYLRVGIENASSKHFEGSVGLMGRFKDGALVGRDGVTVIDDYNKFGDEWQVRNARLGDFRNMLFREAKGPQYPEKCAMPTKNPPAHIVKKQQMLRRRLMAGASMISREQAAEACDAVHVSLSEREDCISDTMTTGDLDMVEEYDAKGL